MLALAPFAGRLGAVPLAGVYDSAIAAIAAYAEQHRSFFNLPGLTLGLTVPGDPQLTRHFGFAEAGAKTAITDRTLFQVGSISKLMTAALVHQYAASGQIRLSDKIADLMPEIPVPAKDGITVQQLLDHVSGLPADSPLFPPGGLWTGFKPGSQWYYSNTGYDILGKLIEHLGGRPLSRQLHDRLFEPLGMAHTIGAITADQRTLFAQGYEAADSAEPFVRGTALAPAAWVDVTFAAGSVASTASDMNLLLRSLADAAQGRGGMGLPPAAALDYVRHAVASDARAMHYGNGLMHVGSNTHNYLHHTGGMVSFSSAFHVDPTSGVGAFASSSISAFAAYRPRLLTLFAVDALSAARAGRPLPKPPPLSIPLANAADFAGSYAGEGGAFEVRTGPAGLSIVADGRDAPLEAWGSDLFRTLHPRFRQFSLLFERGTAKKVVGASWGPSSFARAGSGWSAPTSDPRLAKLAGRYIDDSPWWGAAIIVERAGKLWIGTETPLTPISTNLWRIGEDGWSPERGTFADVIDGRPQTFLFSGEKFVRHDI
ncbi:MAG: serine hydrolase domain-containing protein [Sphingomicrobium sp.]